MRSPLISVVMSVFNEALYVEKTMESLLNQTFMDFQIIVMDDASTDSSLEILRSFDDPRIHVVVNEKNIGLAASLNRGIDMAGGKYIARMDADDTCHPDRFACQIRFLESNRNVVVLGTWAKMVSEEDQYLYTEELPVQSDEMKALLPVSPFIHGSVMMRADALRAAGGYKPEFRNRQDVILWIDMKDRGDFANLPQSLYGFRITSQSNQRKSKLYIAAQNRTILAYYNERRIDTETLNGLAPLGGGLTMRQRRSEYFLLLGKIFIEKRFHRFQSMKYLWRAVATNGLNGTAWFNLFLLMFPYPAIYFWKERRLRAGLYGHGRKINTGVSVDEA